MTKSNNIIYHYTSAEALRGILENKVLWLTNILYLNDSTEFQYALNCFKKYITSIVQKKSNQKISPLYHLLLGYLTSQFEFSEHEIFVFSLSGKADSLSQWRAYAHGNKGFCIGFDLQSIERYSGKINWKLLKCNYSKTELDDYIKNFSEKTINNYKKVQNSAEYVKDGILNTAIFEFQQTATTFKHSAFKEEEEYRLVISNNSTEHKINFREGKSMLIPYLEINLTDKLANDLIKKITIGPTPHSELSKKSVNMLLKKYGFNNCEVEVTEIPFRNW